MAFGAGVGYWGVILPSEKINLCLNSDFEFGTANWGTSTSGTIGTSSAFQQFGAWSCSLQPTSGNTDGIRGGVGSLGPGDYGVSCYLHGANGVTYNLEIAPSPTGAALGSTTVLANGQWQYVSFQYNEASPGSIARTVVVRKRNSADVTAFYVDGVQVEPGSVTTFFNGDQPGGTWLGAQQNSTSVRTGQYRGGGSVVALADLGLQVDQMIGVGVPNVEVSTQSYAVTDGAEFQRQRAAQRSFTLTGKPIAGTSLADFHTVRRTLWDVFKPDLVNPQQPIRLIYYGAQGTQQIDAYYDRGLELGKMDGPIAEDVAIGFIAADPYWHAPTWQGTTLAPRLNLGSTNFMAYKDPHGQWGTLGSNGTTVSGIAAQINDMLYIPSGTLMIGGNFGTLGGGTLYPWCGYYFPQSNTFGTPAAGTLTATSGVNTLVQTPTGTIYVGGDFFSANGSRTGPIAQLTTTWGTLVGGTTTATVTDLVYAPSGTLFASGNFLTVAGTAAPAVLQWTNGAYGSLGPGTIRGGLQRANALAYNSPRKILYVGGDFASANGTQSNGIVQYAGAWGSMSTGVLSPASGGTIVEVLALGPNLVLYGGGEFGSAGGGSVGNVFQWNGVQFTGLGHGVGSTTVGVFSIIAGSSGGLFIGGNNWSGTTSSSPVPDDMAMWNGASYLPMDIDFQNNGTTHGIYDTIGTLWLGGGFQGSARAASVVALVNKGRAITYPHLRLRNLSNTGTARIYQIVNTTTSNGIYFNYAMLPGEQIDLVTQPGARSVQSSFQGNILSSVLPGSNLAEFNLQSGTNYISFFSDSDSLEPSFYWQPRGWSIDSGTVY